MVSLTAVLVVVFVASAALCTVVTYFCKQITASYASIIRADAKAEIEKERQRADMYQKAYTDLCESLKTAQTKTTLIGKFDDLPFKND